MSETANDDAASEAGENAAEEVETADAVETDRAVEGAAAPSGAPRPVDLPDLSGHAPSGEGGNIDMLLDVDLEVKIELGRAEMAIEEVLRLRKGAVVELDKLAGDPVDILVNDKLVAHGEILVVNDNFCVRVTEIVDTEAGLKAGEEK